MRHASVPACLPLLLAASSCDLAWSAARHNLPLDRPYTLRNQEPFLLEHEHGRRISGGEELGFIFPTPCRQGGEPESVCGESAPLRYRDSADRSLLVNPIGGYEYRYRGESVSALDAGLIAAGHNGPVSFQVDARLFTEFHEDSDHGSYDREFVEKQDERASGSVAYSSYSRYRCNLNYDWSWGRLSVGRDAAHWGPALSTSLMFNQEAVPFNQASFTTHLGPLSVQSLYGRLAVDQDWEFDTDADARSLYAHRYELRAARNLLIGISEQLILYRQSAPFALIPIVPLYIAKAAEKERLNNGSIAGDVTYRIPGWAMVYSEFLIDDMQSPTALFNDTWSNKWAWTAGAHLSRARGAGESGLVAEYSRVEPWVYTHYLPNTSQATHFGYPLGNPMGPNSQTITLKAYHRKEGRWYASCRLDWLWKGTSPGSSAEDIFPNGTDSGKEFLAGASHPQFHFRPSGWYSLGPAAAYAELDWSGTFGIGSGIQLRY